MRTKVVSALIVLLLSPLAAAQEIDLPKLLVGKWEGDVVFRGGSKSGDQGRTLHLARRSLLPSGDS